MPKLHTFHIPVMGTGFSIDTPIKVAHYGISSVISLVDDVLLEDMRRIYCQQEKEEYVAITKYEEDFRARRITAYLDLVDRIVKRKFTELKNSSFSPNTEITKYFDLLPDNVPAKKEYLEMLSTDDLLLKKQMQENLRSQMRPGDINVNIMTKVDRTNYASDGKPLAQEFSDALSALRGYALSTLNSGIVFSAGINRHLYSYAEKFKDFYADQSGFIKKKIILKVSDFRSSIIQGKFFAKKGLWVSEYRIESGLNCGGHVFPTDGFLMGPILEEFKTKKNELIASLYQNYNEGLQSKNEKTLQTPPPVKITAQGGIGTAHENQFLLDYYQIDSTGWGTPFLLVPEATNVDEETLQKLVNAGEADLYVSNVSPLGISFNNLRDSISDTEKMRKVEAGRPGSACPKGFLVSNTEFTEQPICTASRQYQKLKVEQLQKLGLDILNYQKQLKKIIDKACICHDLSESAMIIQNVVKAGVKRFPAICPGPNLAYFSKIMTLKEMVDHIYGRTNVLNDTYRPNMFVKELKMYIDHFVKEVQKSLPPSEKQVKYFIEFKSNLLNGIEYYLELFPKMVHETAEYRQKALEELETFRKKLDDFAAEYSSIFSVTVSLAVM
jgi:hypothetical protein